MLASRAACAHEHGVAICETAQSWVTSPRRPVTQAQLRRGLASEYQYKSMNEWDRVDVYEWTLRIE